MGRISLFLDTSHVLALASSRDQFHQRAVTVEAAARRQLVQLVTTRAVLFEIGNAMSGRRDRALGLRWLTALDSDPQIEVVEITPVLYAQAVDLFAARPDKDWGLVDCASFVVMTQRGITAALTHDSHFTQAGFAALLR
jgi:hypothetical protein